MIRLLVSVLLLFPVQSTFAAELDQVKMNASLNLTHCEEVIVDGKLELQNCVANPPVEKDLIFDLTKNCKQLSNGIRCTSSKVFEARMNKGSATTTIIIVKENIGGLKKTQLTIMLTPGMQFSQQSVLNLILPDSGILPPEIRLAASTYQALDDTGIYFPSLVIK